MFVCVHACVCAQVHMGVFNVGLAVWLLLWFDMLVIIVSVI